MNDLIYKNELFSSQEMMVLAALSGIEHIRIMSEGSQQMPEPEELNRIIFQLYQKGSLIWNGKDGYDLQAEIRSLFYDIKYASKELEICSKWQKSPLHCFCSTDITVMELSQTDADRIKVHRISQEQFLTELHDRGIMRLSAGDARKENSGDDWKEVWNQFRKKHPWIMQKEERKPERMKNLLDEAEELIGYAAVYDREKNRNVSEWLFLGSGQSGCVAVVTPEQIQTEEVNEETIRKLLGQNLMEGETKYDDFS